MLFSSNLVASPCMRSSFQGGEVGLSRRIRRHVVLHNHAKCIQSIYTEEIGAAAICETNGSGQVGGVRQPGGVAVIEVVQRPSSSHLMAQLAQVPHSPSMRMFVHPFVDPDPAPTLLIFQAVFRFPGLCKLQGCCNLDKLLKLLWAVTSVSSVTRVTF